MNETTRLYTRDGIKMIDYEIHLKLQKHCEELEALVNHHREKFKEACQHIRDQSQEHRELVEHLRDQLYAEKGKNDEESDQLNQDIQDLKYKLRRAEESIRYKTKVIKEINARLESISLETNPLKARAAACRLIGHIHNALKE